MATVVWETKDSAYHQARVRCPKKVGPGVCSEMDVIVLRHFKNDGDGRGVTHSSERQKAALTVTLSLGPITKFYK